MDQNQLYTLVLGLVPPWMVDNVVFKVEEKRLDLQVTFPKGSRFYLEARQLLFAPPRQRRLQFCAIRHRPRSLGDLRSISPHETR